MRTTDLISALAANRKQFFDLVEAIERESSCVIDTIVLEGKLDSDYAGRVRLSNDEATCLLLLVTHPVIPTDES